MNPHDCRESPKPGHGAIVETVKLIKEVTWQWPGLYRSAGLTLNETPLNRELVHLAMCEVAAYCEALCDNNLKAVAVRIHNEVWKPLRKVYTSL